MADINKFSEQVIDLAERLADMSEAAKGTRKPRRQTSARRKTNAAKTSSGR